MPDGEKTRRRVVETARTMADRKLTMGTWGNVSVRDASGLIYITPSGIPWPDVLPEEIVALDKEGRIVSGRLRPSVEWATHLAVYRARPETGAVVHTHPVYSAVFAVLERELPPCSEDFALMAGGPVRCARYAPPGTEALAQAVVEALGECNAVLLSRHGALCVGKNPEEALLMADLLEKNAQIAIMASSLGNPLYLTAGEIDEMKQLLSGRYGQTGDRS